MPFQSLKRMMAMRCNGVNGRHHFYSVKRIPAHGSNTSRGLSWRILTFGMCNILRMGRYVIGHLWAGIVPQIDHIQGVKLGNWGRYKRKDSPRVNTTVSYSLTRNRNGLQTHRVAFPFQSRHITCGPTDRATPVLSEFPTVA